MSLSGQDQVAEVTVSFQPMTCTPLTNVKHLPMSSLLIFLFLALRSLLCTLGFGVLPPPLCCSQLCEPEEPTFPSCHYSCSLNCGGAERGTRISPLTPSGDRLGVHLLIYQATLLKRSMVQADASAKLVSGCLWAKAVGRAVLCVSKASHCLALCVA